MYNYTKHITFVELLTKKPKNMSLNPDKVNKAPKHLPEAGLQPARCFAIIDLGVQPTSFRGQPGDPQAEVMLCFELTKFMKTFKEEEGPVPAMIMQKYAFSIGKKAKLPAVLKSWGSLKKPVEKLILKPYLGQYCMLNIVHSEDGEYANIGDNGRAVNPFMKEIAKPKEHYAPMFFDLDNFSWADYNKLPKYAQTLLTKCQQWPEILKKYPAPVGQGVTEQHEEAPVVLDEDAPAF